MPVVPSTPCGLWEKDVYDGTHCRTEPDRSP